MVGNFSLLFRYCLTLRVTFIDSPEIGPGTILSPSLLVGERGSSVGAIAGGIVGGIAAVSIVAAALFFYRRRSMVAPTASAGDGVFDPHMDQVQWPISSQETSTTLPGTSTSPMKTYVHVFAPPVPRVCTHVLSPF